MTAWTKHGPHAKMKRRAQQIERIAEAVCAIWDTHTGDNDGRRFQGIAESLWKEIRDIRADTGLAIGVAGETVEIRNGITCLLLQEAQGISDRHTMKRQMEQLIDATKRRRWVLGQLRASLDNVTKPSSQPQYERLALDIADAIDRHEARIRHALPNLRTGASYVILVDPFVVAAQTPGMAGKNPEERASAFARTMNEKAQADRLPFKGARRIANLILSDLGPYMEHEGKLHVKQEIPESTRAAMTSRPLEQLVGNHPAAGMGIIIKSVTSDKDNGTITVSTTAEDHGSLIPVELYI